MDVVKFNKTIGLLLGILLCLVFHLTWFIPLAGASESRGRTDVVRITVNTNNQVSAARVFLKDIADIEADPFLKQTIEQLDISASPAPDQIMALDRSKIAYMIKAQRFLPKDLVFTCPETVYVKRLGQHVKPHEVKRFVKGRIAEKFAGKPVRLEQFKIRGLEPYPLGVVSFATDESKLVAKNGRIAAYVEVMVDKVRMDRLNISGKTAVFDAIAFASRELEKGAVLSREDVYFKKVNIFDFTVPVIRSVDQIEGKLLRSSMRKNDCLKTSVLSDPPLVRKGDIITLVAAHNHLTILATGVSKEDGFENELIKVENLQSGRLLRGIVKAKSRVEVMY